MLENSFSLNLAVLLSVITRLQIAINKQIPKIGWDLGLFFKDSRGVWAWWIELQTTHPDCMYYFGPFSSKTEAENSQDGYVQDLATEGAQNIGVNVKWCKPKQLTIPEF